MNIALEGKRLPDGRLVKAGALWMRDDQKYLPVDWRGKWNDLVGRASELQRDGDVVTMEIEVFKKHRDRIDLEKCEALCYVQPFEGVVSEDGQEFDIIKGCVRGVTLQDADPRFLEAMKREKS